MEQGLYLSHCGIYHIGGNFGEFHEIATFCESVVCEFSCKEQESMWAATRKSYLRPGKRLRGNVQNFHSQNALL